MASLKKEYRTLKDISLDVREKILEDYKSGANSKGKRYSLTDLEIKYHISKSSINKILHQMQDSGNYTINWRGSPIKKPSNLEVRTYEPKHPNLNFLGRVAAGIAVAASLLTPATISDVQITNYSQEQQTAQTTKYHQDEERLVQFPIGQPQPVQADVEAKVEYPPEKSEKIKPRAVFASLNFGVKRALSSFNTLEEELLRFKKYSKEYYEEVARNLPNGLNEGARYDEAHHAIILDGGLAVKPDADLRNMYNMGDPQIALNSGASTETLAGDWNFNNVETIFYFDEQLAIEKHHLTQKQQEELRVKKRNGNLNVESLHVKNIFDT